MANRRARFDAQVPTSVYRFFGADDALIYVGVSDDFDARVKGHQKATWWTLVVRQEVVWYPCRLDALYEESRAIDTEFPLYNRRPGINPVTLAITCGRSRSAAVRTKAAKARMLRDVGQRGAHVAVAYEGAPAGFVVPLDWYQRACGRLGLAVDLAAMATINGEDL